MTLLLVTGCPTSTTEQILSDSPIDNTGNADGSTTDGSSSTTTTDADTVSGECSPDQDFELESETLSIEVLAGATDESVTITMRNAETADLPETLPGDAGFTGAVFGPEGQVFTTPARVSLQLQNQTIVRALPVLTYDTDKSAWVGTDANGVVAANGIDAGFSVSHFSMFGLPDPIPLPEAGDPVGSFVVISNDGNFASEVISSNTAALTYSEFGDTFSISVMSGPSSALGLTAVTVHETGNYIVGTLAGGLSIYNDGGQNESVFGVMIMSVSDSSVSVVVYAATTERVIYGTLTGTSL